ncbi:MAG: SDR family oxidoreductase [Chloroflexi bacterium]|nr:SDR family oxidoreductase [Chloroflexota bacterium]
MTPSYHQNVTVITGASSGIGEALAYELAGQGAWLALAARRLDQLEAVAAKCRSLGGRAIAVECDVTQQADCERLIQGTVTEYARVDTLVNNAGITMWSRFASLKDPALINQIMQVNFLGAVYCTYYALPHLKQSRGRIANISSMADKIITPGSTGYVASKHAMEAFYESLRAEVADDGVSITMLYLGFVDTGFAGRMLGADGKPSGGISRRLEGTQQMTPADSARLIAATTFARRRTVYTSVAGLPGWLFPWLKVLAPNLLERVGKRFMDEGDL